MFNGVHATAALHSQSGGARSWQHTSVFCTPLQRYTPGREARATGSKQILVDRRVPVPSATLPTKVRGPRDWLQTTNQTVF
jgi:hypothetical protein